MLRWLFGRRKSPRAVIVEGNGRFQVPIVGTSRYQKELRRIAGPKGAESKQHDCTAYLVPEPENRFDENAVACYIDGVKVGYLAREHAASFMQQTRDYGEPSLQAQVAARIVGGWKGDRRSGEEDGNYGVRLDWKQS